VLDTSGSMNWSPQCTAADRRRGLLCLVTAPTGRATAGPRSVTIRPRSSARPKALYEVIHSISNIDFGFATYNQDRLGSGNVALPGERHSTCGLPDIGRKRQ
jgi:hypothetical protein